MLNVGGDFLELGVKFVAAFGEDVFVLRGLGCWRGSDFALRIVRGGDLRCCRGGFADGSELFDDGGFLLGAFLLLVLEANDALLVLGFEFLPRFELGGCFGEDGAVEAAPHAHVGHLVRGRRTAQRSRDAVVILQPDRIELVVVAAHATERHAHERLADLADLRVDVIGLHLGLVGIHDLDVAHHEEAGGDDVLRVVLGGFRRHQVAGDLLADEFIERLVRIERGDEVIAIPPRVLGIDAVRGAHHVGVAREIEPVPRPALAVGFGGQEAVHDLLKSLRRAVVGELQDLGCRRREARQVQAHAAQPGVTIRIAGRAQLGALDSGENEPVQRIEWPGLVLHRGQCRIGDRTKRPELFPLLQINAGNNLGRAAAAARIGRAGLDPFFEDRHLGGGEPVFRWHRELVIHAAHSLDEQALIDVAGFDRRAVVATADPAAARIQREPALDLLPVRVALVAALLEQRQHFGFKEHVAVGRCAPERGPRTKQGGDCEREEVRAN